MKCPKCGYMRQSRDDAFVPATECPSCGIVYSKHDTIAAPTGSSLESNKPPTIRPSAVDPESLRRARDRVEKRLRARLETRVRDDRHEQTLEMARKITNESVRDGQDLLRPVLEEKAPKQETAVPDKKEDTLLLDDMIGVQIHSGQNDTPGDDGVTEEDLDDLHAEEDRSADDSDAPEPVDAASEGAEEVADDREAASQEATADTLEFAPPEPDATPAADTVDEHVYPDDVQVETVLLTSHLDDNTDMPIQEVPAPEPADAEEASETQEEEQPEAYIAAAATATSFGAKLTRLLPMVAWLLLITGVVGSVLSWTTITDVEAGVNAPVNDSSSTLLPLGLLLGFAYLATGALGFVFFWVSSMINRQLKDIRQMLVLHSSEMETGELQD